MKARLQADERLAKLPKSARAFMKKYGRYFGANRLQEIAKRGKFLVEARAEGAHITTPDGKKYLDFFLDSGVYNLGHRNPVVFKAVESAMKQEAGGGVFYFTEKKGELAKLMAETTPPGLEIAMPAAGGGEANDLALKMAMAATGRTEVICGTRAYHGSAGISVFAGPPHLREWIPLAPYETKRVDLGDLEGLATSISDKTAAVIYEPARTLSDGFCPGKSYWRDVRRLCDRFGAKLIIDEVVAGMGRMGTVWGCELDDIRPDAMVAAKGLSGGLFPIATAVIRPDLIDSWGEIPFRSYSTFAWMNTGAAAACAAIKETRRLLPSADKMAARLQEALAEVGGRFPSIFRGVKRTGLHCIMEFNREVTSGAEFTQLMFEHGVLLHAAASITDAPAKFFPPLIFTKAHIAECLEKTEAVLKLIAKRS